MSRGREILVGLVIIAAVSVGVVGTLWLGGTNWGRAAVPLQVLLPDVAQLAPGNVVKFRGVQVGRVGDDHGVHRCPYRLQIADIPMAR